MSFDLWRSSFLAGAGRRAPLCALLLLVSADAALAKSATRGPFVFACLGDAPERLSVKHLGAKAQRARLTFRGETVVAKRSVSADGEIYAARDIEFWNKGEDAVLEWRGEKLKCALDK